MTQPRGSSAYLGPEKGRWAPQAWSDILDAAAGGLIDESHWLDLKEQLPAGKRTLNTEVAQDLASLAVDGGLLVIGVEDHNSRAGKVCGVELARLDDRIDQIALDKVRPPLTVRSIPVPDPDREGWGCLLVHVPKSAQAPHMVDHVYYGRGDRGNQRLGDEAIRRIMTERALERIDVTEELRQMAEDDPMGQERELGHLYLLAQPQTANDEILVDLLSTGNPALTIREMLSQIRSSRAFGFEPDVNSLHSRAQRAEGLAFTTFGESARPYERGMLELIVRYDGGVRLICGRGTDFLTDTWHNNPKFTIATLILGLTQAVATLAGQLGDQHAAYQGEWSLGLRMDGLKGASPLDRFQPSEHRTQAGHAYTRDVYERIASASTGELVDAPHAVTERLVAPLLRGLGIAPLYLPYGP